MPAKLVDLEKKLLGNLLIEFRKLFIGKLEKLKVRRHYTSLRLAFIPFLSSCYSLSKNENLVASYNGGMDIKYGINEALTLDVTLLPDFGPVVFDKQVLNISPFEIQFEIDSFLLKV